MYFGKPFNNSTFGKEYWKYPNLDYDTKVSRFRGTKLEITEPSSTQEIRIETPKITRKFGSVGPDIIITGKIDYPLFLKSLNTAGYGVKQKDLTKKTKALYFEDIRVGFAIDKKNKFKKIQLDSNIPYELKIPHNIKDKIKLCEDQ
ncbi:MAG: hypothetical protein J4432_03690 [DPANN group archaeon]|nr:hypothetical protein [DPANN group archaeon]